MKKLLMAMAAVLICTAAHAEPNGEPPYRPGQSVSPDWNGNGPIEGIQPPMSSAPVSEGPQEFVCTPGYDPQDRNPPTNIVVTILLDHGSVLNMEVAYDLRNGERVYRSRQYKATIMADQSLLAGWTGSWVKDPRKTMAGGLYYGKDRRWYYREKQWDSGQVRYDTTAPCNMVDLP